MDIQSMTKKERIDFLFRNKSLIMAKKMSAIKHADHCSGVLRLYDKADVEKSAGSIDLAETDKIKVKAVMNTTNIIDSHMDLHVKGLWTKTLKENKLLYHLEQHKMDFDHVISDSVKAITENTTFSELGYKMEGETQALVFLSEIDKSENAKMFERYAKGQIKNHSVGMRYVKLFLALEDKRYKEEREIWDKYIDEAANKEIAEESGYFYVVTEAKLIEGSAVLLGSNYITPTQSVEAVKFDTSQEPLKSTQISPLRYLAQNFKN